MHFRLVTVKFSIVHNEAIIKSVGFRWTFKLYDRDGSGEIDPDEMEDIFKKLCKIAAGIEADQKKIKAKVGLSKNHHF